MPAPASLSTEQRPDLGILAWEYMTDADLLGYIGLFVMPIFMTSMQSAQYPKIPIEQLLKIMDVDRAPGGDYNRDDFEFEFGNYSTRERGRESPVDDRQAKMYSRYFQAEVVTTKRLVGMVLRAQESRIATIAQNTANAVGNAAVSTIWSNLTTADPGKDIYVAKEAMRVAGGLYPNKVALTRKAFDQVVQTVAFKDNVKYTNSLLEMKGLAAQKAMVAAWWGVDEVLVSDGIRDTAKKGQTASLGRIWDNSKVNLLHVAPGIDDLEQPTFGRTFVWDQESGEGVTVEGYRDDSRRSNIIRVRHDTDEAIVAISANYILTGAV